MGEFLESEKIRLAEYKKNTDDLLMAAKEDGIFKGEPRNFCISESRSEENLFEEIREKALAYFNKHKIEWHDCINKDGKSFPSNHLCDSQVCCVNFLFPFADKPNALKEVFGALYPIKEMLQIKAESQYIAFEWNGEKNYLNEKIQKGSQRTRGKFSTSADAMIQFERKDGCKQTVLIEWKYTEFYSDKSLKISKNGTDRTKIYAPLLIQNDCPINTPALESIDDLFYDPFDQLMRLQLLAKEMEKAREDGADIVSVLYIVPKQNKDIQAVTSRNLQRHGETLIGVWQNLVRFKDKFSHVSTEKLFGSFPADKFPQLRSWNNYTTKRYPWL